jgi:hypothetical protein
MSTVALDEPAPAEAEAVDEGPEISNRRIEVPIASSVGDGYAGTTGPFQVWMSAEEQAILTRLMIAMHEQGVTLHHACGMKAGKVVDSRQDALRVLVQSLMEHGNA